MSDIFGDSKTAFLFFALSARCALCWAAVLCSRIRPPRPQRAHQGIPNPQSPSPRLGTALLILSLLGIAGGAAGAGGRGWRRSTK